MNKGDISRFLDDNKQLGNSQCSPVVNLAVRLYSNSTFKWQIRHFLFSGQWLHPHILVILKFQHNNYEASYLSWA